MPNTTYPELTKGSKGDQVLWLQEHLAAAIPSQETTGNFGTPDDRPTSRPSRPRTGIEPSGVATAQTWAALLALAPVAVNWTGTGPSA